MIVSGVISYRVALACKGPFAHDPDGLPVWLTVISAGYIELDGAGNGSVLIASIMARKMDYDRSAPREERMDRVSGRPLKMPFVLAYARYANAERARGRQPMPPIAWLNRKPQ